MNDESFLSRLDELRRTSGIRIDRKGRWWHQNTIFEHRRIIETLNKGLAWLPADTNQHLYNDEDDSSSGAFKNWLGEATLHIGKQWCYINCELTPFLVLKLKENPISSDLIAILNTGENIPLGTLSLFEDVLYTRLRSDCLARFSVQAQAQLGTWLEEDESGVLFLTYQEKSWPITNCKKLPLKD